MGSWSPFARAAYHNVYRCLIISQPHPSTPTIQATTVTGPAKHMTSDSHGHINLCMLSLANLDLEVAD